MIQSLQVNIMVSYKNYVTNYNIYTWLEWLGGGEKGSKHESILSGFFSSLNSLEFEIIFAYNAMLDIHQTSYRNWIAYMIS